MGNKYFSSRRWPAKKRDYPLTEMEVSFQAEPMFDAVKLRDVYEYYLSRRKEGVDIQDTEALFNYLYRLEKDVPLNQQKIQP